MTTLAQNSSQTTANSSYFDAHVGVGRFEPMENPQENDCAFRITQVREMQREATYPFPRKQFSKSPEDDLDDITQAFGDWSLFGRTKEDVILNPGFQVGLNIRFKEFLDCEDGKVPVVTLDDIKGSKVIIPPIIPPPPLYATEVSSSSGGPDATMGFGSLALSHGVGAAFDIPPYGSEGITEFEDRQRILPQVVNHIPRTTEPSPALYNHVISSDTASPLQTSLELQINDHKAPREVPTLHLNLQEIKNDFTSTYMPASSLYHTDTQNEQVAASGERTNPLLSQALLDSWNAVPSSSPVQYPFEQTPAPAELPFPIKSPAHSSQPINCDSQNIHPLFDQPIDDGALDIPPTDIETQSYSRYDSSLLSRWSSPPGLSPSYTDGSQDSTLYTPISSASPMSLSFVASSHPVAAAPASQHPLPPQDVLADNSCVNPAFLTLNTLHFEEPFPPYVAPEENTRYRTTQRAAQVHEFIMVQVAPYPIGPPTSKMKDPPRTKGKGKVNAKLDEDGGDSDGVDAREKVHQKKKKRDEADKVRCEIDGCNGTFFSNWDLKRHQKNLHGIGEDTPNTAVCPKCGRHFGSRRKDSVDRHLQRNACGKRNPRKSLKRITPGQPS